MRLAFVHLELPIFEEKMEQDANLKRMFMPCNIDNLELSENLLMRRFAVEQCLCVDGSANVRSVEDASACGTNGCSSSSDVGQQAGLSTHRSTPKI